MSIIDVAASATTHQAKQSVHAIVDGLGNVISHVVPSGGGVGLGALFNALDDGQ